MEKSKRTEYFTKAAKQSGVFVSVMGMEEFITYSDTFDNGIINMSKIREAKIARRENNSQVIRGFLI